ncbi:hypothetical protein AAES_123002 [Amazona aestiva]|uniref:Uncharacterized protein n=1 Tax=Amazona aestiva TaxID=12930 RepID=A0A0Q3QXP8_AMAAE|nr:hypothetical protein AAES_123002 [Amazona aestiva]
MKGTCMKISSTPGLYKVGVDKILHAASLQNLSDGKYNTRGDPCPLIISRPRILEPGLNKSNFSGFSRAADDCNGSPQRPQDPITQNQVLCACQGSSALKAEAKAQCHLAIKTSIHKIFIISRHTCGLAITDSLDQKQDSPYSNRNLTVTLPKMSKESCINIHRKRGLDLHDCIEILGPIEQRLTCTSSEVV